MTIKKRLARSNIVMLVIPVLVAAVLLLIGMGIGFTLLASFMIASCCHALCAHFVRAQGNTALFIGLNVLFPAVFQWGVYAVAYKIPTILTILSVVFMDVWQLSAIAESC